MSRATCKWDLDGLSPPVIWLQRLRSRKSQHLPLGCIYWVSHYSPPPPTSLSQHCFIPCPVKISCHQHSSAVSPEQLWSIPGNQSPSNQLTIFNHKHVKMSEYFEKSYRTPATFNFRIWKYRGRKDQMFHLSTSKPNLLIFNFEIGYFIVILRLLIEMNVTIFSVSHMKLNCYCKWVIFCKLYRITISINCGICLSFMFT